MESIELEGKIKSIERKDTETEDLQKEVETMNITTAGVENVKIQGETGILLGFKPGQDVVVVLKRVQKTIKESLGDGKKK